MMIQTVVEHGTAAGRASIGRPVAGKTGTTNDTRDAWFIGFTPDLLAGVWVGYDSERSLGSWDTGGHAAAPIWAGFMRKALEGRPVVDFPVPSGRARRERLARRFRGRRRRLEAAHPAPAAHGAPCRSGRSAGGSHRSARSRRTSSTLRAGVTAATTAAL